jgi:hypothetical protein
MNSDTTIPRIECTTFNVLSSFRKDGVPVLLVSVIVHNRWRSRRGLSKPFVLFKNLVKRFMLCEKIVVLGEQQIRGRKVRDGKELVEAAT